MQTTNGTSHTFETPPPLPTMMRRFGDQPTLEYQELKFTLHRKLLDRINLETLSTMAGERMRIEVRVAVARLVEEEKFPAKNLPGYMEYRKQVQHRLVPYVW